MPRLSGVFDQFANLDNITAEDINRWLKVKIEQHALDNFIANRIYYPQTIPMTVQEMEIDLALLREALKSGDKKFYNLSTNKIIIPDEFVNRFYPTYQLVTAFIDGLKLSLNEITQVFLQQAGTKKLVGSIFLPATIPEKNPVSIKIGQQKYELRLNTLTLLPINQIGLKITIEQDKELVIDGGSIGIFVDLRRK